MHSLHGAGLGHAGSARDHGLGGLDIGGPPAATVDELRLAVLSDGHELGGDLAADLPGVRFDLAVLEPGALADASVRTAHRVVVFLQRRLVGVEAVRIFHDELTTAEQAEARPDLVAELDLDLVERDRELAEAAHLVAYEARDDLLMGRSETELATVAILQTHELGTVDVPASGLLPELGGLHGRHEHLLATDRVHLLAHDLLDLAQAAPTKRQEAVDARSVLANHAGTK